MNTNQKEHAVQTGSPYSCPFVPIRGFKSHPPSRSKKSSTTRNATPMSSRVANSSG